MNKWLTLLIVVGLAAAGWLNHDKISQYLAQRGVQQMVGLATPVPPMTPNPAAESVVLAKKAYPALAKEGSAFNKKFVALYNSLKDSDPNFLAQPDWPVLLAQRTATELGGGAMPLPGAAAAPAMSSQPFASKLDPKHPAGTTPAPIGSALDQTPVSTRRH